MILRLYRTSLSCRSGQNIAVYLKMILTWNVHATVSLLVYMVVGIHFERSENCHQGSMKADVTAALHGSVVNLSCWLNNDQQCPSRDRFSILQNHSEINISYGLSVSACISLDTFGMQTFTCQCLWTKSLRQICGVYIHVGIPPDQPKNIVCIQHGKSGNTTCTWETGSYTYLNTVYKLQLTNGATNGTFFEVKSTHGLVDLGAKLGFESMYTATVIATNKLGSAASLPIQFTLMDIIKPHFPLDLLVKFDGFDATKCTVSWQDQQETQLFRLRYRPFNSSSWTMVGNINTSRYSVHDLKPVTEYEFQVSCKFLPNRGLWSDWSMSNQIEAVPFEPVDVWYQKKDVSFQMQNITLFWKTVKTSSTRRSHYHTVTFQPLNQMYHRAAGTTSTTQLVFSQVTPKTDYIITVHAYNSRGISPAASITTELRISDLPPPCNISAGSMGNGSILVAWKAPLPPSPFINGYVVEWVEFHQGSHLTTHPNWLKIPASHFTAIIDNLKPNMCYRIRVFALYQNRAGKAASTSGDVSANAQLTGPHINTTVKGGSILVSWEEIPEDEQKGCVDSYKIYLQKQFSTDAPKVYDIPKASPQPFPIKDVQRDAAYALWMTAFTKTGESPKGNEEVIYIENAPDLAPVSSIYIIVGLSACVCCVLAVKQMWCSKAVPDPANSSWAKQFTSVKDESSLYFFQFLNSFEEPEPLQIEEAFIKSLAFKDVLFKSTEKGESLLDLPTANSFQEDSLTVKVSDYNPLITSMLHDTNLDKQQLSSLYRKVALEEPNQGQEFSEYLANPFEDSTIDYLPFTAPAIMNTNEESSGSELSSFPGFQRTSFLPQMSFGGTLTLDAIRMDCNSFTD